MVKMSAPPKGGLFYRGKWLWMWPNWTLSLFDGGMNTSRINPVGPKQTELIYNFYFKDLSENGAEIRAKTIADNLAVIREDFEICIETHKNYVSGAYRPGPLSPRHEQGVAYFQRRLTEAAV
jgi:choline monooxygenase